MDQKIPLFKIYWDEEDVKVVTGVLKKGSHWATGEEIQRFEKEIVDYVGSRYALTFNSGTSALHAMMLAHNVKEGDEVIVPSFTFIATANAPIFTGAKPIFAEIEGETYGLDPKDVETKITNKTKAIMPIHYAGCPCLNTEKLKQIAEDNKLLLIEDAAQSLGAKIGNKMVGTFGTSSMFSLCQDKIISSGEGGIITTDSNEVYKKLKLIRSHGRQEQSNHLSPPKNNDYTNLGYNFRMSTLSAALASSQLKKIGKIIKMRKEKADFYTRHLSEIKGITLPATPTNFTNVYQKYTIQVDHNLREKLKSHLSSKGILTRVYFNPVHLTSIYRNKFGFSENTLPTTESISKRTLSLPIYPVLTQEEMKLIVDSISEFMENNV